jgi:hypothetical protein
VATFGTDGVFQGAQLLNFTQPAIGLRANGDIWTAWVGPDACPVSQQTAATGSAAAGFGGLLFICANPGVPPDSNWSIGGAVALPNGSLVAAFRKGTSVVVAKGLPDGSATDPTWGNGFDGTTIAEDAIPSLAVDSHGLVLVTLLRPGGLRFVRMTATGGLDASFGQGGKVVHSFGTNQQITRVAVQKDGRIVVLGTEEFTDGTDMTLSRYWY